MLILACQLSIVQKSFTEGKINDFLDEKLSRMAI